MMKLFYLPYSAKALKQAFCGVGFTVLTACSNTPPTQFYTLDATVEPSVYKKTELLKAHLVGIGPIMLPAQLNRKAIVTRGTQQSIQVADNQQWAEPLLDNIARVIARNLATLQPSLILHVYPWVAFGEVDQRFVIEVTQFEAYLGKEVLFDAVWSLKDEHQGLIIKQGHSKRQLSLASRETAEVVLKMNAILASFSTELATALE